jgi:hypothetical protein
MSLERAVWLLAIVLYPVTLTGLAARRRMGLCYSFVAYLIAVLVGDVLQFFWPGRFWNWDFYVLKESIYVLIKFLVALELIAVVFQAFPGAAGTARLAMFFCLGGTLIGLLYAPGHRERMMNIATDLHPRVSNGSAGLFVLILVLSIWYRIPVHDFHRAIARGFALYLVVAAVALYQLGQIDWADKLINGLLVVTYTAVLFYWTWAAWRREEAAPVSEETLRRVQPWRDRL